MPFIRRALLPIAIFCIIIGLSGHSANAIPNLQPRQLPIIEQRKLYPQPYETSGYFGSLTALSKAGTTAVITGVRSNMGQVEATVYIFVQSDNLWLLQASIGVPFDAFSFEGFNSLAVSDDGNTIIAGIRWHSDPPHVNNGAVYIFTRTGANWSSPLQLLAPDRQDSERFGWSVALSGDGNIALIGADGEDLETEDYGYNNGAVYVFTRSGNVWTEQAKLRTDDAEPYAYFGTAVALSRDGSLAVISAPWKTIGGLRYSGAIYTFSHVGSTWIQQSVFTLSPSEWESSLGNALTLDASANTLLVGAPGNDENGIYNVGAAYVLTRTSYTWSKQAKFLAPVREMSDYMGESIALTDNGNLAAVGARYKNTFPYTRNGEVYFFVRTGNSWTLQTELLASDKEDDDLFGSVALSRDGGLALIGAGRFMGGAPGAGKAYIYKDLPITPTPTIVPTATITPTRVPPASDTVGAFSNGYWYLHLASVPGYFVSVNFGGNGDRAVLGDWNGDGIDTLGVFRASTGFFILSDSNTTPAANYQVLFGDPGDQPFAGRWTADMNHDGIGVYRNSNGILYQKKALTSGFSDYFAVFGNPGDYPLAGDWNGDGFDSIGIYRPSVHTWYLSNNSTPSGITLSDLSIVWDIGTNMPIAGDWNGDGVTTLGYYNPTLGRFLLHSSSEAATGRDEIIKYGPQNAQPVTGKWVAVSGGLPGNVLVNGAVRIDPNARVGNTD